jgi:hypothetical protein
VSHPLVTVHDRLDRDTAQGALLEQLGVLVTKRNMMIQGSVQNCVAAPLPIWNCTEASKSPYTFVNREQQPPPWLGGVHPALPKPTECGAPAGEVGDAEWGDFYMTTIP